MEIPVTLRCKQNVGSLALVAREGTEMVEKVMGDSWKDRPSSPFKHTAILSAVP
jgi:hypothetical protein